MPTVRLANVSGSIRRIRAVVILAASGALLSASFIVPASVASSQAANAPSLPASCAPDVTPTPSPTGPTEGPTIISADEVVTTLTLHYRPQEANGTHWVVWSWENAQGQVGSDFEFTGTDSYGCVATITYPRAVKSIGFIVHQKDTWNKDVAADRFATVTNLKAEIWLRSGDARVYTDPSRALNPPHPADPTWTKNAVIYQVNVRDFSTVGNFQGVTDQLARLKAMGVTVLYLMPIHPIGALNRKCSSTVNNASSPSRAVCKGSPYSVRDYQAVNSDYGTLADFKKLVNQAHAIGMHVILDWVMNHTAFDNVWVAQHKDYYLTDPSGKLQPPVSDWSDVAQLNFANPELQITMLNAMKFWVVKYGVDGYRLDYASSPHISLEDWDRMATTLNAIKPLFFLAEADSYQALLQSAFVSDYNLPFLYSFLNSVGQGGASKGNFTSQVQRLKSYYPSNTYPVNFITNHDWNAWYGTEFERMGCEGLDRDGRCTNSPAVAATTTLTALWKGIPMLYNGQEIGLNRRLQFFLKDPIAWPVGMKGQVPATWTKSSPWVKFYTKLYDLKAKNPALASGNFGGDVVEVSNTSDKVVSFTRTKGSNTVLFVLNISKSAAQTVTVNTGLVNQKLYRYNTGFKTTVNGSLTLTLKPLQSEIYSSVAASTK
jgi:glycosidase